MYFVFDLDGTLLNDSHQVPKGTLNWIKELKAQGHKLAINTGRPMESIFHTLPKEVTSLFDAISSYNGGWIKFEGKEYKNPVDNNFFQKFIKKYNDAKFTIAISAGEYLYTNSVEGAEPSISRLNPTVRPLEEIKDQEVYTIRLIDNDFIENKKSYEMMKKYQGDFNVVMSTGIFILMTSKKASKNNLIEMIQAKGEKVLYFGDSHNDLSVFEMDNVFTVAPANAFSGVKELADLVLDKSNNESLVFDFEEKVL